MHTTRLRGARTHNLRGVDLDLAPGSLVVVAGPSGAGKSSLAFGTLYAEGQRRYVESFSAYARQFLERLARPPVDSLDPVPVAIAVDRQAPIRTSRSTVGTMTELTDLLKLLYAELAEPICEGCGAPVRRDGPQQGARRVVDTLDGQRIVVTYPVAIRDETHYLGVRDALIGDGYRRVLLDGEARDLDEVRPSDALAGGASELDVVADRLVAGEDERTRITEALEAAMRRGGGRADVFRERARALRLSNALRCEACARTYAPASAGLFSFNSPVGACPTCKGFGRVIGLDVAKVIPDGSLSLAEGAIKPWTGKSTEWERRQLRKFAKKAGVPMDVPVDELSEAHRAFVLDGDELGYPDGFWGVRGWFRWLETRTYKMHVRVLLSRYRSYDPCPDCEGTRLCREALAWKIEGRSIADTLALPAAEALEFVRRLETLHGDREAAANVLERAARRLSTIVDVGLGYLSLDRPSRTLSGGEAQRVSLTGALGASLSGALFVLDEPTVGLHPRDVSRLVSVLRRLCDGGNIALLVEHHPDVIAAADRVVELGPGAGAHGGRIVFDGPPSALREAGTATGRALRGLPPPAPSARAPRGTLRLCGARGNNLRDVDLSLPLGALTCVIGASGSGKSSLILETLEPAVARALGQAAEPPLPFARLEGLAGLRGVVGVDQSPLGRTSRGNAATYLKVWDVFRKRLAATPLAKERGYGPGFFSFNVAGGRCEACKGEGAETVEMQFLADVTFSCPSCGGRRFSGEVLDVTIEGKSAADLMELSAEEACELFSEDRLVRRGLLPMLEVGLGYLRLGQSLSTLSGGEAQRLKLAAALSSATPGALILLDEPTAGLHAEDVTPLLAVFDALVARGDTVVVVEHNMRVAAHADHVVELGPGAGAEGGHIVAAGTPRALADGASLSAPYLSAALGDATLARERPATTGPTLHVDTGVIAITGATEHNLADVSLTIPRGKLVAMTGPSGSGKSSLAFDVLYAEAQRRYLETLSPYARQYMPSLPRPAVESIEGVPPSVSLEQRITRGGLNSTVATVTEVAHYLRLLYARAGTLHCPGCGVPITPKPAAALARSIAKDARACREVTVLAPVVRGRRGSHRELFAKARRDGITEARVDGAWLSIATDTKLERYKEHDVSLVVGRVAGDDEALEALVRGALERGDGAASVVLDGVERFLSTRRSCPRCGEGFPELDPRFFSANTRQGQCAVCTADDAPEGPCDACGGSRLSPLARAVTVDGMSIDELFALSVAEAEAQLGRVRLPKREALIAKVPLAEAARRLAFLTRLGLGYLSLDRPASSLSGGELQRVRLSAQLGAGLTGVLYVLDEPTIGLHPRDTHLLIDALRGIVDRGNSVLVVEHDTAVIRAAEHVIDVGPGGGRHGGRIVAEGPPAQVERDPRSATGRALHRGVVAPPHRRDCDTGPRLELTGATLHNLRGDAVEVPLGRLVSVTGVSGSGKSTLVRGVLLPKVRRALGLVAESDPSGTLRGFESLARAVEVDQGPIGRTPRSVPATYVGIWDELRKLLAATPLARARGYGPARFSFNVEGGRCPECKGQGATVAEMSFLPDVLVGCDRCGGARFGDDTLDVQLYGRSAGELLDLEVGEAAELFSAVPKVARPLALLRDLGLHYLRLGQASNTLSGGEAQRLKLVAELSAGGSSGPTLYVLDEPTTGLHREDVDRLLALLHRFVERGDTVVVIEHQTDVIFASDWVIDLGPEGGAGGGHVVVAGPPERVMACRRSHTGKVLKAEAEG